MTETEQAGGTQRSGLNSKWVFRIAAITVVLIAFGGWGFYDAVVAYPNRGKSFASYQQWEYLKHAQSIGRILDVGIIDPAGRLADLESRDATGRSEFDRLQMEWLKALAVPGLGMLDAEHTVIDDPRGELDRLTEKFSTGGHLKKLSNYDILTQWLICGVCWAIALYLIVLVLMVKSKVYKWNAESTTLTLPDGTTISPNDLDPDDPADLSRWQKFIVILRPRPAHQLLKGPVRFDVFRYTPVEDWLRTLVKSVDPELEFPDETKARLAAEAAANEPAETQEDDGQSRDA